MANGKLETSHTYIRHDINDNDNNNNIGIDLVHTHIYNIDIYFIF